MRNSDEACVWNYFMHIILFRKQTQKNNCWIIWGCERMAWKWKVSGDAGKTKFMRGQCIRARLSTRGIYSCKNWFQLYHSCEMSQMGHNRCSISDIGGNIWCGEAIGILEKNLIWKISDIRGKIQCGKVFDVMRLTYEMGRHLWPSGIGSRLGRNRLF